MKSFPTICIEESNASPGVNYQSLKLYFFIFNLKLSNYVLNFSKYNFFLHSLVWTVKLFCLCPRLGRGRDFS